MAGGSPPKPAAARPAAAQPPRAKPPASKSPASEPPAAKPPPGKPSAGEPQAGAPPAAAPPGAGPGGARAPPAPWPQPGHGAPPGGAGPAGGAGLAGPVDRLREEFNVPLEGHVAPHALVVRPSLWAGLEMLGRVLAQLAPLFVVLGVSLWRSEAFESAQGPWFLVLFDRFEFFIGIALAFAPIVRVAFTRYTLDDEGIRVRIAILQKSEHRVPWDKVTALRHRRSILGYLLGFETLEVVAYGKRGARVDLVGLREAAKLRAIVGRRMRQAASVESLFTGD